MVGACIQSPVPTGKMQVNNTKELKRENKPSVQISIGEFCQPSSERIGELNVFTFPAIKLKVDCYQRVTSEFMTLYSCL